ncbi:MAG: hypothetical protein QOD75_1185 [Blastocatellia bacterium]|jgi:hypothetical protein|nr:hypothetical protein [Blastocatellia bacterium]
MPAASLPRVTITILLFAFGDDVVMKIRFAVLLLLSILLVAPPVNAGPKQPQREVFGLRLGMNEETVHRVLKKIATQQKEEREEEGEGEQEVWVLKKDSRFDYLLVRFDAQHELWLITVVVHKDAGVRYGDLGALQNAKHATDGRNVTYKWSVAAKGKQAGYVVIARGSNPDTLTSYSISRAARQ